MQVEGVTEDRSRDCGEVRVAGLGGVERVFAYQCSPRGKAEAIEQARDVAAKQATVDRMLASLPDFSRPIVVLAWLNAFAEAADRMGVVYDRRVLRSVFAVAGWPPGAHCGVLFDGNDARNFAGWIVGQWLDLPYPWLVSRFVREWLEKFSPGETAAAPAA